MVQFESLSFETSLQKTDKILQVTGLQTDDKETNWNFMQRLWNRKFYCFFNTMLYCEVLGAVAYMVKSIMDGNFVEATNCAPCATLCFLGTAKTYYRLKYSHHINDLIHTLRKLQSTHLNSGTGKSLTANGEARNMIRKLHLSIKILTIVNVTVLIAFCLGPFIIMAFIYSQTGKVELRYPFLLLYPFDVFNINVYPFMYVCHVIGGTFAVFTVFGPDCLYYTFCTYVQVQFRLLYQDFETIIPQRAILRIQNVNDEYHKKLRACVIHHKELIRCCNLIETVYSKSALFNFMSSTLLLCMAGFNIMAYEDLAMFSNFLSFLFMCLLQIYLICDYGDGVSRALPCVSVTNDNVLPRIRVERDQLKLAAVTKSMDLGNAVYNSQWYVVEAKTAKDLLMILTRAQKPCKLTAYMFTEINLGAFTRILSTSWSYFALLRSVYSRGGEH